MVPVIIKQCQDKLRVLGWAKFRFTTQGNTMVEAISPMGTRVKIWGLTLGDCITTIRSPEIYPTGMLTLTETEGYKRWVRWKLDSKKSGGHTTSSPDQGD